MWKENKGLEFLFTHLLTSGIQSSLLPAALLPRPGHGNSSGSLLVFLHSDRRESLSPCGLLQCVFRSSWRHPQKMGSPGMGCYPTQLIRNNIPTRIITAGLLLSGYSSNTQPLRSCVMSAFLLSTDETLSMPRNNSISTLQIPEQHL